MSVALDFQDSPELEQTLKLKMFIWLLTDHPLHRYLNRKPKLNLRLYRYETTPYQLVTFVDLVHVFFSFYKNNIRSLIEYIKILHKFNIVLY